MLILPWSLRVRSLQRHEWPRSNINSRPLRRGPLKWTWLPPLPPLPPYLNWKKKKEEEEECSGRSPISSTPARLRYKTTRQGADTGLLYNLIFIRGGNENNIKCQHICLVFPEFLRRLRVPGDGSIWKIRDCYLGGFIWEQTAARWRCGGFEGRLCSASQGF